MKKPAKPAAKKAAAKKVAPATKKAATKKAVKKVAAKKTAPKKTAAKKVAASSAASSTGTKTTIEASVDVGFGNALFIRGDAPGLSWSKGVPMDCQGTDKWSIAMAGVAAAFEYKVLVNDVHWCVGSNFVATPGKTNSAAPTF